MLAIILMRAIRGEAYPGMVRHTPSRPWYGLVCFHRAVGDNSAMRSRLLHNLLLAAAVLALALFLFFRPEPAGPQRFALSMLRAADVVAIELAPRAQGPIVLERGKAGWHVRAPRNARADEERIKAVLNILGAQSERRLPPGDSAKFGLAPPTLRLTVRTAREAQVFDFGDTQPVTGEVYVATGGAVYLVSPVYTVDVSGGVEAFLAKKLLAEDEHPVGFTLPGLSLLLENGRWRREPDDGRFSADQLNRFADEWRLATATRVGEGQPGQAASRIAVRLADGRSLAFTLLARQPEWVLRREDEGLHYHFAPDVGERLLDPARLGTP